MDIIDNIIGYEGIKKEIRKFCDIMLNPAKYHALGAKLPNGIMFFGEPGVGKSLMANCLIQASKRPCFTCRKNKPNGEFVNEIRNTFNEALTNAPSIVFLDDMDKFANEDQKKTNTEEYITIQSCIDEIKNKDVLVIATVNDKFLLPPSLLREGRFDEKIEVQNPTGEDAEKIIKHFLSQKKYVADLNIKEVSRLLNGFSCAELESLINKAGVIAGFDNKEKIEFEDIMKAYVKTCFSAPPSSTTRSKNELEVIAYHETGHAIVSEILQPESVSLTSIANHMGSVGGFTAYYESDDYWIDKKYMENRIMTLLAGKAIIELKYGRVDVGASSDIERAVRIAKRLVSQYCTYSFSEYIAKYEDNPQLAIQNSHIRVSGELDRYYQKCKHILAENMNIVEIMTKELMKKNLLSHTDIARIIKENAK